jgi:cellobiose phosphorylase
MNKVYSFDDPKKAIDIFRYDLPSPWINYLSNGNLHAFVSQAGGGFLWLKSPVIMRITRYRQYHLPIDSPGFYLYIRHADGTVWSPTVRPLDLIPDKWKATHQPGISSFSGSKKGVSADVSFFITPEHDVMVWDTAIKNNSKAPVTLDLFAYQEYSQMKWDIELSYGYYVKLMHKSFRDQKADALYYLNHTENPRFDEVPLVFFTSSEGTADFDCDRDVFMGNYRDERNPAAVEKGKCSRSEMTCGEPCAAVRNRVTLKPGQEKRIQYFTGVVPAGCVHFPKALAAMRKKCEVVRRPGFADGQRLKLTDWWEKHMSVYQVRLPEPDAARQINIWSPLNSVHTGRYSRSVNTVAPGVRGIGFRDSCQDMLAVAYRKPDWATEMFLYLLSQQYADGHCVHTSFPEEKKPPATSVHSDDHLWLPMLLYAILAETGDYGLLQRQVPWLHTDSIGAGAQATVWEHMLAAMKFTETHRGTHALPLTLASDWNDIIGRFAVKGKGETVFAAQQYVYCLNLLHAIAIATGAQQDVAWLQGCRERQIAAILASAWDGKWWCRGFDDDGNPVGSRSCSAGKIFINSQSWAVISAVGSPSQHRSAMNNVARYLDKGMGLIKLWPAFPSWGGDKNTVISYGPGCGENGAIFCHANTWAIMAEALLGNAGRAWKYFNEILPHHALNKVGLERYKSEPYAWVSNIVGPGNNKEGWANVNQITGTAAWMDVAATQYLLGIRPSLDGLIIDPCIPADWKGFSVERIFRGTKAIITIDNPQRIEKGVSSINVDGKNLTSAEFPIIPKECFGTKDVIRVKVTMGS